MYENKNSEATKSGINLAESRDILINLQKRCYSQIYIYVVSVEWDVTFQIRF